MPSSPSLWWPSLIELCPLDTCHMSLDPASWGAVCDCNHISYSNSDWQAPQKSIFPRPINCISVRVTGENLQILSCSDSFNSTGKGLSIHSLLLRLSLDNCWRSKLDQNKILVKWVSLISLWSFLHALSEHSKVIKPQNWMSWSKQQWGTQPV